MDNHSDNNNSRKAFSIRIRTCRSDKGCKYACTSGDLIKERIETAFGHLQFPAKIKIGISGCVRCCTSPKLRDIGLIATPKGWEVHFGGNSGYHPRIALQIASGLTEEEALDVIDRLITYYRMHSKNGQRTSSFLNSFGEHKLLQAISSKK